jgi:hypothetical protein
MDYTGGSSSARHSESESDISLALASEGEGFELEYQGFVALSEGGDYPKPLSVRLRRF